MLILYSHIIIKLREKAKNFRTASEAETDVEEQMVCGKSQRLLSGLY